MARRCFEVKKLVITFCCCGDQEGRKDFIYEKLKELLRKYASNTDFEITSTLKVGYNTDVEVGVILAKNVSVITMMTLLSYMLGEELHELNYVPSEKNMNVSVLG